MSPVVLALVLWAPLVCADSVSPLECYQCIKAGNNSACKVSRCGTQDTTCFTYHVEGKIGLVDTTQITKGCTSVCNMSPSPSWSDIPINQMLSIEAKCCSLHLCNQASTPRSLCLLLGLGLSLLLALP